MIQALVPLWAAFLIPLAFWAPLEDAFKLPQSVLSVMLALFLAASRILRPVLPRSVVFIPVTVAMLGYAASSLLGRMTRISDVAVFLALALSAVLLADRREQGRKMVAAMIAAGTLSSLYCFLQFAGLDILPSPGMGAGLRPFSTMGNPDFMAAFLVAVLPIAAVNWTAGNSAINALPVASMAAALLLTQSRGAWLGAVAGLIAVPFLLLIPGKRVAVPGKMVSAGLVMLALVVGFFFLHGQARERLSRTFSTGHFDAAGRLFMWKAGMGMIRERPLTGTGPGGFGAAYPEWHARGLAKNPGFPWFFTDNAHNDYLQIPAELGLPVFGLVIWLWAVFAGMAVGLVRRGDNLALGILVGFISLQVDALFNFPWYIVPTQAWFWIGLAVLAGRYSGRAVPSLDGMAKSGLSRLRGAALVLPVMAVILAMFRDVQANAWLKLSGDNLAVGRYPEARAMAESADSRWNFWESRVRCANNASLASYSMDDFIAAEKFSKLSLSLAPRMPGALAQLALSQARAGRLVEAEKDCRESLSLNPHQAEAWHVLGNIAYLRRDLRGARQAWEKAYAENPSIPGLAQNLEVLRRNPGAVRKRL